MTSPRRSASLEAAREEEGKSYLALPDHFDIHEWAIMERFSEALQNAQIRKDFRGGVHGSGAFRLFKRLLDEYKLVGRLESVQATRTSADGHRMV